MDNELIYKMHDLSYKITDKEIKDLQELCYSYTNSYFPIGDFFNDIRDSGPHFNKNQAYKDLYLIILHFDYYYKKSNEGVEIIKEKEVDCNTLMFYLKKFNEIGHIDYAFDSYNDYAKDSDKPQLTKEQFELLKEVLL